MTFKTVNHLHVCAVCGSSEFKRIANLNVSTLEKCFSCGLVENRIISAVNESDYYENVYQPLYEEYYKKFRKYQYHKVMKLLEKISFPSKKVLDVGCSYGWFLQISSAAHWESCGVEPSRKVFEYLTSIGQPNIYNLGADELYKIPGQFGLITLWNVFEHLPCPKEALDSISEKLMPHGVLLICVPNYKGLITKFSFLIYWLTRGRIQKHLYKLYQLDNGYPHLFHFNKSNLEFLLKKNGFDPFDAWEQDIVDVTNLNVRIRSYSNGNIIVGFVVKILLGLMQRVARITWNDEIVILARKSSNVKAVDQTLKSENPIR